ncbi:MAG: primosomal protein N' [Christensenellaceae bacterium]|nr:MAG: primosomal protein N' [Clostridiales bacterium]
MIAEVIVDIAAGETDRIYDYLCDDDIKAGSRVRAPFGGKIVSGFVMRLKETSDVPPGRLKRVFPCSDGLPALNPECLALAGKLTARYRVPMALSLRLFLPSEMRAGKVRELKKNYASLLVPLSEMSLSKTAKNQRGAAEYLEKNGKTECGFLNGLFPGGVAALEKKGYALVKKEQLLRDPYKGLEVEHFDRELTEDQRRAVERIERDERTVQLLHGVTGSGKTEIYLTLIAKCLKEGKSSIFLVPEISLTPQMLSQLRARFGRNAAIMHSGLSAGEKFDEWWRLRTGEAKIAIGARSAVFTPLENLGVIIIDEEHDSSYSSETAPRYNTFDVAYLRAKYNGCKLVLGSATPAVDTYKRAIDGEFGLIRLEKRINRKPLPEIVIADMRREVRRGNNSAFSAALREELDKCLKEGNQAILFLNRRGYSQTVICKECGYVAKCEACDVSLTYHRDEDCLKCHYCGARYRVPTVCPDCGGRKLSYAGTGTQRIAAELEKLYPSARVLRMDNDTTSGKEGHYKILKAFGEKRADILVGTQMIAKGHDFPSVTLVGILDADMSLHFSDYRSGERTFQLITQVAGRSGRAEEKGKVVLQTFSPENDVLRYAVAYDYEGFYQNEISLRAATMFPPFSKIVRVLVTGEDEKKALEALRGVYFSLERLYTEHAEKFLFFNKMHAPIKRIQNKFRYQVLMRLSDTSVLPLVYDACAEARTRDVLVSVEENPTNLS